MSEMVKRFFYYANLTWVRGLLFFVASTDVQGKENVPRKGPVILAFNHMSNGDPPVLTGAMPRRLTWMVKAEWFKTPVIGQLFRLAGMIPVRRFEADLQALRHAQEALEKGDALGMFPEGHRSGDKGMQKGEPGTALIAMRTGAPIVPTAIWGTEHVKLPRDLLRRTRAHVRFGKPFRLDTPSRITREAVLSGTETIMKEIAALLPEQHRGVYKDAPMPEVAIPKTE